MAYIKQLNNKHLPKNLYIHILYMYFVDDELNSLIKAKRQIKQLMKMNINETERVGRQTTQSVDTVLRDTTNSNGTIKDAITGLRTCSQIVFESNNMIKPFSKGEKMYFRSIPNFQQFSQRTFQMANILESIVLSFSKIMTNINFVPPETIDEYKREFDKFKDVYGQLSNKIYATFYAEEKVKEAAYNLKFDRQAAYDQYLKDMVKWNERVEQNNKILAENQKIADNAIEEYKKSKIQRAKNLTSPTPKEIEQFIEDFKYSPLLGEYFVIGDKPKTVRKPKANDPSIEFEPYQTTEDPTYNVATKGPSAKDDEMEENLVKLYSNIYNNIKQLQSYEQEINSTYNYIPSQTPSRESNNGPTKPIIELTNDLQDQEE
jgi:hypothetical protein